MSDITLEYYGSVSDTGEIKLPKRMRQEIAKAFPGRSIEVTVRRKRRRRSTSQNAYYWGIIVPAVLHWFIDAGNDLQAGNPAHREQVHEFLKRRFLDNGPEVADKEGVLHRLPPSTTRCTTVEQEEYHDRIRQFAAEFLGVVIPLPNEQAEIW